MSNQQTNQEELFEIESGVKMTRESTIPSSKLSNKIYNTADKLQVKQSFFIPIAEFNCSSKNALKVCHYPLKKLKNYYKDSGITVNYRANGVRNENKEIIGIRIFRVE